MILGIPKELCNKVRGETLVYIVELRRISGRAKHTRSSFGYLADLGHVAGKSRATIECVRWDPYFARNLSRAHRTRVLQKQWAYHRVA